MDLALIADCSSFFCRQNSCRTHGICFYTGDQTQGEVEPCIYTIKSYFFSAQRWCPSKVACFFCYIMCSFTVLPFSQL